VAITSVIIGVRRLPNSLKRRRAPYRTEGGWRGRRLRHDPPGGLHTNSLAGLLVNEEAKFLNHP